MRAVAADDDDDDDDAVDDDDRPPTCQQPDSGRRPDGYTPDTPADAGAVGRSCGWLAWARVRCGRGLSGGERLWVRPTYAQATRARGCPASQQGGKPPAQPPGLPCASRCSMMPAPSLRQRDRSSMLLTPMHAAAPVLRAVGGDACQSAAQRLRHTGGGGRQRGR